jgi:hypothetical protein
MLSTRCLINRQRNNPDGYLIEIGQYTERALDWFKNRSSAELTSVRSKKA